ncbi:hypothetical protein D9M72_102370 [compost metagenome]
MRDEGARQALDTVGAGLAVGFAAVAVAADFVVRQFPHADFGDGHGLQQPVAGPYGDGGAHFVRQAGQRAQDPHGVVPVGGLAQDLAGQDDGGVGGQQGQARQAAVEHPVAAAQRLVARGAPDVVGGALARMPGFVLARRGGHEQHFVGQADLRQQFAPPGAGRSEVQARGRGRRGGGVGHASVEGAPARLARRGRLGAAG